MLKPLLQQAKDDKPARASNNMRGRVRVSEKWESYIPRSFNSTPVVESNENHTLPSTQPLDNII